jgi:hypothetical protein
LEDWGKATWVEWIVKKAKAIISFIQKHHEQLAIYWCETPLLGLSLWDQPNDVKPHWNAVCNEFFNHWKLRPTIEQIITDHDWTTFLNTLCGSHYQKSFTTVRVVQANVRRDEFWDTCVNFVHMVKLILMSLGIWW